MQQQQMMQMAQAAQMGGAMPPQGQPNGGPPQGLGQ